MNSLPQLRLLQLVSPGLPIGSYAYSQGLEYAVESGWVNDQQSTGQWLQGILNTSFCATDLTLLRRCYQAWQANDLNAVDHWNSYVFACRETREFTLEEQQLGYALRKLLLAIEPVCVPDNESVAHWSYIALYARAAQYWEIDLQNAVLGFAHAWLENQISCAIKLVPLGQVAGQRLICEMQPEIIRAVSASYNITDDQIGLSLPGLSIASCQHETQYTRLFRS